MSSGRGITAQNFRLYLTFQDRLKQVEVTAATNRIAPSLRPMGGVEGKEQLLGLLESAGIDHYIVSNGDLGRWVAIPKSSASIVAELEKVFERGDAIPLKILGGEQLTEEELAFTPRLAETNPSTKMLFETCIRRHGNTSYPTKVNLKRAKVRPRGGSQIAPESRAASYAQK